MTLEVRRRVEACLRRLVRYFDPEDVELTGGVAIEHHLAAGGRPSLRTKVADLDFVARRGDELARATAADFLVSHYHRAGAGVPKPLVQLVDPGTRLRIDIFPETGDALAHARRATVAAVSLSLLSARSILEHKLRTIAKATAASPVDPKHWRDAVALAELTGCALPPPPLHVAPAVLCTDVDLGCVRCDLSREPGVRLAPKREIFEILGYV